MNTESVTDCWNSNIEGVDYAHARAMCTRPIFRRGSEANPQHDQSEESIPPLLSANVSYCMYICFDCNIIVLHSHSKMNHLQNE